MVNIIVPTYNQSNLTIACFKSIISNTPSEKYRLVWIDDCSEQKSFLNVRQWILKQKINLHIIVNKTNMGFAKTVNIAILACKEFNDSNAIILLNNDTIVTQDWLLGLVPQLSFYDIIGVVTTPKTQWQSYHTLFNLLNIDIPNLSNNIDAEKYITNNFKNQYAFVSGVSFFCVAFNMSIFEHVGLLSEDYGKGYGEDCDYCKRAINNKKRIAISLGTFIYHKHHGTFNEVYSQQELKKIRSEHLQLFKNKFNINNHYAEHKAPNK